MMKVKDSGVSYIGNIPISWYTKKIKYVAVECSENGLMNPKESQYIGLENIVGYSNRIIITNTEYELSIQKRCYKDNILFGKLRPYLSKVVIAPYDGFCTGEFLELTKYKGDIRFLRYSLLNANLIDTINMSTYGAKMPRANSEFIMNCYIAYPTYNEQKIISDFLDTKCEEIEALSMDIQAEIDTLEEYKCSIIIEKVKKGLNLDVTMKDSRIEWIGMIPSSWSIHPVYHYFGERKARNYDLKEQNLLSLSYGKIIRKDINASGGLLPANFSTYNIVEAGDIIIRSTDLQNDKRSLRTGLVTEHGIITSAYIDLMPKSGVNSKYFHYLLHAYDIMKVFYNMGNGVRQGLNYSEFSKLRVIAPSREEQQEIVDYLDNKCERIDSIIETKKEQLTVLDEYKKAIIYEYVTGKKEVV